MPQCRTQVIANRRFGVEIEVFGTTRNVVQAAFGRAGLNIESLSSHTSNGPTWRMVVDSSISPMGFEVVSPILQGEEGIASVRKVCKLLVECGAKVNKTCGLHVHTDARDLTVDECKTVARRYNDHVEVIDTFFPASRREGGVYGGSNTHAAELAEFTHKNAHIGRYRKVNLASLSQHGTIEFRQHSGTVNADKVEHWIRFCVAFVEASRVGAPTTQAQGVPGRRRLPKKVQIHRLCGWVIEGLREGTVRSPAEVAAFLGITTGSAETYLSILRHAVLSHTGGYIYRGREPQIREYEAWYAAQATLLASTGVTTRVTHEVYGPRLVEKLRKLAAKLEHGYPVYFPELAAEIDVAEQSIPGYVARLRKLCGAKISCRRSSGRVMFRYQLTGWMTLRTFGRGLETPQELAEALRRCATERTPARPQTAPQAPQGDTWDRGLPQEVVSFYTERASDLNGGNLPEVFTRVQVQVQPPPVVPARAAVSSTPYQTFDINPSQPYGNSYNTLGSVISPEASYAP